MTADDLQELLDQLTHAYFTYHDVDNSAAVEIWHAVTALKAVLAHLEAHE